MPTIKNDPGTPKIVIKPATSHVPSGKPANNQPKTK
jgi:hypothetical protein